MERIEILARQRATPFRWIAFPAWTLGTAAILTGAPSIAALTGIAFGLLVGRVIWLILLTTPDQLRSLLAIGTGALAAMSMAMLAFEIPRTAGAAVLVIAVCTICAGEVLTRRRVGQRVVIGAEAIELHTSYPKSRTVAIRWAEVDHFRTETLAEAKASHYPGDAVRAADFVEVGSRGKRIRISAHGFDLSEEHIAEIGIRASAAVVASLRAQVKTSGRVDLGPMTLTREDITWIDERGPGSYLAMVFVPILATLAAHLVATTLFGAKRLEPAVLCAIPVLAVWLTVWRSAILRRHRLGLGQITDVLLLDRTLAIQSGQGAYEIEVSRVKNGLWVPQIVRELQPRSRGPALQVVPAQTRDPASLARDLGLGGALTAVVIGGLVSTIGLFPLYYHLEHGTELPLGIVLQMLIALVGLVLVGGGLHLASRILYARLGPRFGSLFRLMARGTRTVIVDPRGDSGGRVNAIRVFVSSTFRDMHAERDLLVKRVFPEIRKFCERRGIFFSDVDLRWGITEEKASRGEVIRTCLDEIDRCRPYFVCLLGRRYGEIPEMIPADVAERVDWLRGAPGLSFTDIEARYAVLDSASAATRAFFYFRHPEYDRRSAFVDRAEGGLPEGQEQLASLREEIRASSAHVREGYPDPAALVALVLEDLTKALAADFPERSPDDRHAARHEAWAQHRLGVYVGRHADFDRLSRHVRERGPPLVVTGDSGSGKSALLANWLHARRMTGAGDVVLQHFVGSNASSTDWKSMLRWMTRELARVFELEVELPAAPAALRAAFASCLTLVPAHARVVLVIDALNQLDDRDGALDLVWLPRTLPANVRVVVSTLAGRTLTELTARRCPVLRVRPLDPHQRRQIVRHYLGGFRKELAERQVEQIVTHAQTPNPLYLRVVLEELRVFGSYDRLQARIEHYLAAPDCDALFDLVLERYEQDYDVERASLVRDAMTLIWVSRQGLSEAEILDLLGSGGDPLPAAWWSPLRLAAEPFLVNRSGLLGFSHEFLRRAVERRYFSDAEQIRATQGKLVAYFSGRTGEPRAVDELLEQAQSLGWWDHIFELLSDPGVRERVAGGSAFSLPSIFEKLEANSTHRTVDACRDVIDDPGTHAASVLPTARVLLDTGHFEHALPLCRFHVRQCKHDDDVESLATAINELARAELCLGRYMDAQSRLEELDDLCRKHGLHSSLQVCLGSMAVALEELGYEDMAANALEEQVALCRERGDREALQSALGRQGELFERIGGEPLPLYVEKEQLCRELGLFEELAWTLSMQARHESTAHTRLQCFKKEEQIRRSLDDRQGLQICLRNQRMVFEGLGQRLPAMLVSLELARLGEDTDPLWTR